MTGPSDVEVIQRITTLGPVPLVPEIQLYQASDPMAAWHTIEERQAGPTWTRRSGPFPGRAARPWPGTCSTTPKQSRAGG